MIIIGSECIRYWYSDFPREPKDIDVIVKEGEKVNLTGDYKRIEILKNPVLLDYYQSNNKYLPPNLLYTLKISHIFWDINWDKHMWDIQWLKKKGCKMDLKLFNRLYDYWNTTNGKNKRSDLKMTSDDFFDNVVSCKYDHDWLHTLIQNPPTYTKILKGEVDVCEDKFNELTFEEKCSLVREEVMIMAYERYQGDYRIAYSKMLRKFIRNHAPLWEALFIIDNYLELYKPIDYKKIIEDGIKKVKPVFKKSAQLTQ